MAQNDFLDEHVGKVSGYQLTFDKLIDKLDADVYGREMRTDISRSVQALGSAITELHNGDSGVGWTNYQIDLLETILKAAAYADTGIGDEINRLIASLRHTKVLVGLQVSPETITVNAGDSLSSIRNEITVTAISTDGYVESNDPIDDYNLNGSLIQGKDCPVSVSYTKDGFTISKTITVTVRGRQPSSMTARLFGNVDSLPVGVKSEEIADAIYAQITYDDGYRETISDLIIGDNTVTPYTNQWVAISRAYRQMRAILEFYGDSPILSGHAQVAYLLEGCSSTNTDSVAPEGENFNTIVSPNHGTIESLKVFVNGVDCTSLFAPDGKTVNILGAYVTGLGRIVISARASSSCTITYHLTNCTSSNTVESVSYDGAFLTVISPNDGYELDLENTYIIMGSSKISSTDGTFSILGVTNNIDVYGVAKAESSGEVTLSSISASYAGGTVAAGTTLEQLTGITVTATYSDGSTGTVTGYKLSGNLTAGKTNTITVTYQGKTATFEVTVEAESVDPGVDVIATYGRAEGYRISTSGGTNSALSGCVAVGAKNDATGIIPYKVGDVFYIKGITFPSVETNGSVIVFYSDSNGSHQRNAAQVIYNYENTTFPATFSYSASTGVLTVRINNIMIADSISHPYLRFSLLCSDVSQLKVMKNEVI